MLRLYHTATGRNFYATTSPQKKMTPSPLEEVPTTQAREKGLQAAESIEGRVQRMFVSDGGCECER